MKIVMLLYPHMTALDFVGPHEILSRIPGADVCRVAEQTGPIPTDSGLTLIADHAIEHVSQADLLFIPGATDVWPQTRRPQLLSWLRDIHETTTWTTSVCTGSLLLAAAGLLHNHRATSHWAEQATLRQFGAEPTSARIVESGKILTGAGVSAGLDLALVLVARIKGDGLAMAIQLGIEYDPDPPFDCGSPDKAPPAVKVQIETMLQTVSTQGAFS